MSLSNKQAKRVADQELFLRSQGWISCLNCVCGSKVKDSAGLESIFCVLYRQNPPLSVVVTACESWVSEDEIPF